MIIMGDLSKFKKLIIGIAKKEQAPRINSRTRRHFTSITFKILSTNNNGIE